MPSPTQWTGITLAENNPLGCESRRQRVLLKHAREPAAVQHPLAVRPRLPNLDGPEMGTIRVGIPDTMQASQLLLVPQGHQRAQRRMEPEFRCELANLIARNRQLWPGLIIRLVVVGNEGVQPVIPAM